MDFGKYSVRPFNRGNKLLSTSRESAGMNPDKPSLWAASHADEQLKFSRQEERRVITSKFYRHRVGKTVLEKESPYYGINIEGCFRITVDYWSVLEEPEQLKSLKSAIHTIESDNLQKLANTFMEMIVEEKQKNLEIQKLLAKIQDSEFDSLKIQLSDYFAQSNELLSRLAMIRGHLADCLFMNRYLKKNVLKVEDADERLQ